MPLFKFVCRLTSRQSLAAGCLRPIACHPQVTPCNALTAKDLRPTTCYLPSPTSDSNCRNEKTTSSDRLILIDITELAQRLHVRPQARKWRCSHHTFQQVVGRCRERRTISNIRLNRCARNHRLNACCTSVRTSVQARIFECATRMREIDLKRKKYRKFVGQRGRGAMTAEALEIET